MKIVLYLLLLVVLLIASFSLKEGFETGRYAYLAPVKPYVLDETTKRNFITAYNNSGGLVFPNAAIKDGNVEQFVKLATLDEINYYIQNKKWPINSYITNYIDVNKATIVDGLNKIKINSIDDLYRILPTRFIYLYFIGPKEAELSPVPLSHDIYTGKQTAPVDASSPTESTPFSSENYSKLQSICSTIN